MTVKLKDMLNRLSPAEQHAVAARSAELIAEEMSFLFPEESRREEKLFRYGAA